MTELARWLPFLVTLLGVAGVLGSARSELRQLREMLSEHRALAAIRDASVATKLDTLLSHHAELTSRVAVLERDMAHNTARDLAAGDSVRLNRADIEGRVRTLETHHVSPVSPIGRR